MSMSLLRHTVVGNRRGLAVRLWEATRPKYRATLFWDLPELAKLPAFNLQLLQSPEVHAFEIGDEPLCVMWFSELSYGGRGAFMHFHVMRRHEAALKTAGWLVLRNTALRSILLCYPANFRGLDKWAAYLNFRFLATLPEACHIESQGREHDGRLWQQDIISDWGYERENEPGLFCQREPIGRDHLVEIDP